MMYRKLLQTLILTSIFTVLACAGLDNIPISESSDTQIEGATIFEAFAEDLGFGEFMNIRLVENEALENQGVSKNQIDQVFITKLTLEILSPRAVMISLFSNPLRSRFAARVWRLWISHAAGILSRASQNRSRHRRRGYRSLRRPRFDGYHHRGEWPPTKQ